MVKNGCSAWPQAIVGARGVGRCTAIVFGGAGGAVRARKYWTWSEVPHDEILEPAKGRLHRAALVRHLEAAHARQARLFEQPHDGGCTRLGPHVGPRAGIIWDAPADGLEEDVLAQF